MIKLFGGSRRENGLFTMSIGIDPAYTHVETDEHRAWAEISIESYINRMSEWDDEAAWELLDFLMFELFTDLIDIVRIKEFVADAKYYAELVVEEDGHEGFYFLYLWRKI